MIYMAYYRLHVLKGGGHMEKNNKVFVVADYFLKMVDRDAGGSITHLKLQKLVYYAQAWHLVFTGKPLFSNEIQAWVHGPVCPDLYKKYADYRYENLPEPNATPELSKDEMDTLEAVWECYGDYDGKYLEQLTHQEIDGKLHEEAINLGSTALNLYLLN